jgi:hypothetical protein
VDRYSDPAMQPDWSRPFTFDWHPARPTATQETATPGTLRRLAVPLALPPVVTADYTLARDGSRYEVSLVTAALDPALNRGHRQASFLPWHDGTQFCVIHVRTEPGNRATEADLAACPGCSSPWATRTHASDGYRTDCTACSYSRVRA